MACACQNRGYSSIEGLEDMPYELIGGSVVGGYAAVKIDPLLDKVSFLQTNPMLKQALKVVVGVGLMVAMPEQKFVQGIGTGMCAVGGALLVKTVMKDTTPIAGTSNQIMGNDYADQLNTQQKYIGAGSSNQISEQYNPMADQLNTQQYFVSGNEDITIN